MSDPFDLSLTGRKSIVCGSSAGIGLGCAKALLRAGAEVVINGRDENRLRATEVLLRQDFSPLVTAVAADVATFEGRQELLRVCPEPDILICNSAGPPPGSYLDFDETDWLAALNAGMVAPIALMKSVSADMSRRGWGRIIAISSTSIRAPLAELDLSNGVRSGLAGFMAALARDVAPHGVTVNAILPGLVTTQRLDGYLGALADAQSRDAAAVRADALRAIPAGRFGSPEEIGALCAFLASGPAGLLTGLSLLADGGMIPVR